MSVAAAVPSLAASTLAVPSPSALPLQFADALFEFLSPSTLAEVFVRGVAEASLYVMIAAGLTLVFGLMGVLNFAHGSLTMLGAYIGGLVLVAVVGQSSGGAARLLAFGVAVVVAFGLLAALGGGVEIGLIRPIYDRPPLYQILLTFGLTLVLDEIARILVLFYGLQPSTVWQDVLGTKPQFLAASIGVGGVSASGLELFQIAFGVLTVVGVHLFLTRTRYGLFVRAGGEDSEMLSALGVDVRRVFTVVFALGTGIAGAAGVLLAWDPSWGASVPLAAETLLPAFVVVIVGGLGTFRGTIVAAVIVGMVDSSMTWWFQNFIDFTGLPEMVVFLVLVITLIVKPQGLYGVSEVGGH
ncbi:branched-chain amino acid ABC transporter permease (plasmid) [Halobaculum sp. CBA1158]|uniref:branched-chain amino acid ABC transporter permease n=1 Tax=Halobaculum sp. CBA1158 TaxID=2904243 RepID=UPI001F471E4D|nr:branched-chain amino acid ABC transporter permease [Halobaculum sp. CBA1158]UIP01339.1 branched-chain amino acid ABC transporter permease [Halobaculum sp. CBA1158]